MKLPKFPNPLSGARRAAAKTKIIGRFAGRSQLASALSVKGLLSYALAAPRVGRGGVEAGDDDIDDEALVLVAQEQEVKDAQQETAAQSGYAATQSWY